MATAATACASSSSTCSVSNMFHMWKGLHLGLALVLVGMEHFWLKKLFSSWYQSSSSFPHASHAFGLVVACNILLSVFTLGWLGFKVMHSREFFKEKARKDGDEGEVLNFSYPKVYAEGNSENARKFNSIQRGHQHALETYTQFMMLSLIGGMEFPISVALGGILWAVGRMHFAQVYAKELSPEKNWTHPISHGIYLGGLAIPLVATAVTALNMSGLLPLSSLWLTSKAAAVHAVSSITSKAADLTGKHPHHEH